MFKLFKRKNEVKELERRVLVIESNITNLIRQSGMYRVYNSPVAYTKGEFTLENIEFISKLAKELSSVFEENQKDKVTGDLILQIDGSVIGKVALNQLNKMQRQSGIKMVNV